MPHSVTGIVETALSVRNLPQAAMFYRELFEFPILTETERLVAMNVADRNVLLLFDQKESPQPVETDGGLIPPHAGGGEGHLAFSISADSWPDWEKRLMERGIEIESVVQWPRGGRSMYFRDPDHHLVELVTPGIWAIY